MSKEYTRKVTSKDTLGAHESVLLFDDCEGTIDWFDGGSTGADFLIEFANGKAFRGKQSLHIVTKTTTPAIADTVNAARGVGLRESQKLRISTLLELEDDLGNFKAGIGAKISNASKYYQPELAVDFSPPGFFYLNSAGEWVNTGLDFTATSWIWYRLEMVVDARTGKYVSVKIGNQELKLDVAMKEVAVSQPGLVMMHCFITAEAAAQVEAYFDEIAVVEA